MNHLKNILIALFITLVPAVIFFVPLFIGYNKTNASTFVLDKDYSHLTREEIINKLNQDFVLPDSFNFYLDQQQTFSIPLASFSASLDREKLTDSLLSHRFSEGIFQYLKYLFHRQNFNLIVNYDNNLLDQQISLIGEKINKPFIPTEIQLKSDKLNITKGSLGTEIDSESLKNNIISNLTLGNFNETVKISTHSIGSIPNDQKVEAVKVKAQKIINKNISLSLENNITTIDSATLISWLGFESNFQENKIADYVKSLAESFNHDPIDAVFKFENNQVLEFQPAQKGIVIKQEELIALIKENLSKLIDSSDKSISIPIPSDQTEPIVRNNDVNNLGIKELLGQGTSTFKHSSATRNENVSKGSSIVNRILVAPGDTFSFIKSLGEVSLEAGYKKAYIIREGKTELDVGGGICQVSTTLFRAMLDAGLDVTQRQAHAYRVSYYEEDSKPGFDATVFIPSPDLKFVNDTGHYVLVQNILDMTNRRLTYQIYGTSDGRKAEITNYRQWDSTPAPPDVWIDDPTLPVGKTIQDEHAIPGLKTSFDWIVKKSDGSILHQKTFTSNFVPWAAVYRRGTKQ